MALTSDDFFTNVATGAPGTNSWNNISSVLESTGEADTNFDSGLNTETVTLDTPLSGSEVPIDATIENIQISFHCYHENTGPGIECYPGNVTIVPGLVKNIITLMGIVPSSLFYTGDLAFWGLTNSEAMDFATGTADLTMQFLLDFGSTGNFDAFLVFAKCQFTYTAISTTVSPPVLF
jgi:hypothetical protein